MATMGPIEGGVAWPTGDGTVERKNRGDVPAEEGVNKLAQTILGSLEHKEVAPLDVSVKVVKLTKKTEGKELFQKLVSKISTMPKEELSMLTEPIAYAYDPKVTSGAESKGLVSYKLIEVERELEVGGIKLSDKVPEGKSIRIPEGFKIDKICGGGSGSVNMLISNEKGERFFIKYFHSADASLKGHNWKQQFGETVAMLNQQAGNIPLLQNTELHPDVEIHKERAQELSEEYRMQVYQLGVVVGFSEGEGLQSLARGEGEYNLETSIGRMGESMDNAVVEATFALSQVAHGAEDLCDVITSTESNIDNLVGVSTSYLEDMTGFQLGIASRELSLEESQNNEDKQFVGKMQGRFAQLETEKFSEVRDIPLREDVAGLETINSMVTSESFKFAGQVYPNPSQFLPDLFEKFPTLFCDKMEVADVHGDGQASNLMYDSENKKLVQVDVRKGDELVSPHAEAAKMVVFGPEFTGCILNGLSRVEVDESGLKLIGEGRSHLERHREYKTKLLETLANSEKMQEFQQKVSPDFGLNIRLLGAVQVEADIGSFLSKFITSPDDDRLKRRAVADKVLALQLQKELFDYIADENNFPESEDLNTERARLKEYVTTVMLGLNPGMHSEE